MHTCRSCLSSMETPEPGAADGEERLVELRPRTRSNPEGAEDRRSSTGSLGGSLGGGQPGGGHEPRQPSARSGQPGGGGGRGLHQ